MLGKLDPKHREVTIVGAGVSGLLAAYYLDQAGYEVTLIEKTSRPGGLIQTKNTPYGIAETAVHSFLASPEVKKLCEELKLELLGVEPDSRTRFIYRRNKLKRFPLSVFETLVALFRSYFLLSSSKDPNSLTMQDWGKRHFGQAVVDYLLSPFLTGIYAASPSQISVKAAFPTLLVPKGHSFWSDRLARAFRSNRGATKKTRSSMMTLKGGSESLTQALAEHLKKRLGTRFQLSSGVQELPQSKNVILCTPAYEAAELLKPSCPELSGALSKIQYSPLIAVTAFISRSSLSRPVRGVGVLIPKKENSKILGVLFNSCAFKGRVSDESHLSLTVMIGGSTSPEALQWSEAEIRSVITQELEKILGLREEPIHLEISKWPRAIPLYDTHLLQTWRLAEETWCREPGHLLFGNYAGQVSVRGMIETASKLRPSGETQI